MKLSPLDLEHQEFARHWRGYDREQVSEFLGHAASTLEQSLRDNQQLHDRIRELETDLEARDTDLAKQQRDAEETCDRLQQEIDKRDERIASLQASEQELRQAIVAAQRLSNDIKANASKEAELIVQRAKDEAEQLHQQNAQAKRMAQAELARLEHQVDLFKEQFRGLLRAYERSLDKKAKVTPPVHAPQSVEAAD